MDNTRFFLYAALALVMFMVWQAWRTDQAPRPDPIAASQQVPERVGEPTPRRDLPELPTTTEAIPTAGPLPDAPTQSVVASDRRIRVVTDVYEIELDTAGGDIRSLLLLEYPLHKLEPDRSFPLLSDTLPAFYIVQGGLLTGDENAPTHHVRWQVARGDFRLAEGADELRVPLVYDDGAGLRVTKTYVFRRGDYEIAVEHQVENATGAPWRGGAYLQLQRTETTPVEPSWFVYTFTGAAVHDGRKYRKIPFDDLVSTRVAEEHTGGWAAMVQHYFVGAVIPPADGVNHYYSMLLDAGRYVVGVRQPVVQIDDGATATISSRLFLGPKLQDRVAAVAPGLERTVDYGWLTFLAQPLFWVLDKIHSVVNNWGWSIILLTILIKLAFFKLSETSYRSMANMRKVQPRMKALQERYKDDRQRLNQAMMDLYKTEKINPLGGCLPILVQIPVFIALYWVLLESVELRQAPWALWIQDLSSRDPFFVLPLLMGASMLLQQRLNPAPMDPVQQKVMTFLPIIFTVFFAFFPAGLVLYWFVNNLISLGQQYYITRKIEAGGK
ncbi:MAG: membrane protein insertase YidC [Xanthomonadaceae bacterium]|nr:membrane protein insertase YidC [Xanthomonadaceae bacterium]